MRKTIFFTIIAMLLITAGCDEKYGNKDEYFASFAYNGQSYRISNDHLCQYTYSEVFEGYPQYIILAADGENTFQINISQYLESGETYDILNSTNIEPADINMVFTVDGIEDESYMTYDYSVEKIGELKITALDKNKMEGTFYCKTQKGDLTSGKFYVRYEDGQW
jgi:hypothetical protein